MFFERYFIEKNVRSKIFRSKPKLCTKTNKKIQIFFIVYTLEQYKKKAKKNCSVAEDSSHKNYADA